jgi:hypothetical protein
MGNKINELNPESVLQLNKYNHTAQFLVGPAADKEPSTPSEWFSKRFPEQQKRFGAAILESVCVDHEGEKKITPLSLNEEFLAGILGGDARLQHKVIYFQPDQAFYFYDPRTDFFAPTTDEKLKILLSQYFVKCAEAMPRSVDILPLFETFRTDSSLKSILRKAKALLSAEDSFFSPESPHKRARGPEIHEKLARMFVKSTIKLEPLQILTVSQCFELFCEFCKANGISPILRRHFKPMLADVIRDEFDLGYRKDLPGPNSKAAAGWKGLTAQTSALSTRMQ